MATSNKVTQSETRTVLRSSFHGSSYNPRKISDGARKALKKNIKESGLLGGILINEKTGNIISGHQRISVIDEINKYNDETKENDYEIKVEYVNVDEKKEKELNIFLNSKSVMGEYDYAKLAVMIPEIDVNLAGLDDIDLSMVDVYIPSTTDYEVPDFLPQIEKKIEAEIESGKYDETDKADNEETDGNNEGEETKEPELSAEEKKALVKEIKAKVKEGAVYEGEPYFTVSFDSYENKAFFLERFHISADVRFIKGEELAEKLDEISV